MSTSETLLVGTLTFGFVLWNVWRLRSSRRTDIHIPGPSAPSWIYGNMAELLLSEEYGAHEFQWQEKYGSVYAIKGCFGQTRLMVSDPVAAKTILNNPVFVHGATQDKAADILFGYGNVFLARGENHRRLRNIMNPAFSSGSVRAMLPIIKEVSRKLVERWEFLGFPGNTVDIAPSMHDAAFDAMGDAILEHPFHVLSGDNELVKTQRTIIDSVTGATKLGLIADAFLPYVPGPIFHLALRLPIAGVRAIQNFRTITDTLNEHLMWQKSDDLAKGVELDQSFMSHFVKWNCTSDAMSKIPDSEIAAQLRAVFIAGEDTSGGTLGWILYKLAQMGDFQKDLREEISAACANHIDEPDYDRMPLLNAIINEVLRLYSPLPLAERVAVADCVIPLSQPIITTAGEEITQIPIKKGQYVYVAIASYHRLPSLWGADAHEFRPARWLKKDTCKGPALGPHASLLAFLGGPGVCLGWRFALLELQVFVVELLRNFVVTIPEGNSVRPCIAITLVPKTADGVQRLPLHIESVV
ncbi:cytochrome P450 [Mycena epipterygia]|nr:cytochrome P450 [Mycena epipterygia]